MTERKLAVPKVPQLMKVEGRNLGFDALADVCDIDVRNRSQVGRLTRALKDIREYAWQETREWHDPPEGELFERALASLIRSRAEQYTAVMPRGSWLTPTALSAWWHRVGATAHSPTSRGLTPEEIDRRYGGEG